MASISNDSNGRRRIQFVASDGKRRAIRLGKVSHRQAESVKVKIEDIVSAAITGHTPKDVTSRWLTGLDDALYSKLASVGLVKPRGAATLGRFTRDYIDGRKDIKAATRINLERARSYLVGFFAESRPLRDFTQGDADDFHQHLVGQGKAENTVRRALGRARQFFNAAKKHNLVTENPFDAVSVSMRTNTDRFHFVSREDASKVIDACPDIEWQLIFALARFGGLRCPSEVLALTWGDINWEHNRIRVPSPKTERHDGGESRMIPLFPELRPLLMEAFEAAEPGSEHVITRYRGGSTNLRTQLHRIIRKAGLEPWPKSFQNLRSTRETELAEEFPIHVVCAWIGNSQPVAAKHYLQLTDEHFMRAIVEESVDAVPAAQNAAQKAHEVTGNSRKTVPSADDQIAVSSSSFSGFPAASEYFTDSKVPCVGLEPCRIAL